MNDVFETIDNNCKTFKERNIFEKDMKDYMNEVFQIFDTGDEKQNQKGKTTGDGSLDKDEWKKMLESGFNLKLTIKDCEKVISKMDSDSDGTVDAIEFAIFINNMLRFTDKMRANYLKEDPAFHPTVFKIVDSIKKELIIFQKENKKMIENIQEKFFDAEDLNSSDESIGSSGIAATPWGKYGGDGTGELDAPGLQNLIEDHVHLKKNEEKLNLKKLKEVLIARNKYKSPVINKEDLCTMISQGFRLTTSVRDEMVNDKKKYNKVDRMFNTIMLKFYDEVKDLVQIEPTNNLPEAGKKCWMKNLTDRWDGILINATFQGTYRGAINRKFHHVELFEDEEELHNVIIEEIIFYDEFKIKTGDVISAFRESWEDTYEGKVLNVGNDGKMEVEFVDETLNDIIMDDIYHVDEPPAE